MNIKYAYFGSSNLSVTVLDEMEKAGMLPTIIITTPDKPQGRKLVITPNVVKTWGISHNIPVYDKAKLDTSFVQEYKEQVESQDIEIAVVASYGKIMPSAILDIPKYGTLNIHPSLLPKYRGASPLPTAMLEDEKHTGVTILKVDAEMDHGPIVAKENVNISEWPTYEEFEENMARIGARLLIKSLEKIIEVGAVESAEQEHDKASYTKKIIKTDGQIDLTADAYTNFRKIQAYHEWPQAYFLHERDGKQIRVKITKAQFGDKKLTIEKVIPEGKKEISYEDFLKGYSERS